MAIDIEHQHKFPHSNIESILLYTLLIVFTMQCNAMQNGLSDSVQLKKKEEINTINNRPEFVIHCGRPETRSKQKFSNFINTLAFIDVSDLFLTELMINVSEIRSIINNNGN